LPPQNKKSLLLHFRSSRLCALSVWLFADYNFEFDHAEFGLFFALRTVHRKIQQYGVLIDFDLASGSALGAGKPE
jgi:hypothetical protein